MNKVENVKLCDLHPYAGNSRVHSERQIVALKDSLREFGVVKPILIDENNTILAGHGVYAAAQELQLDVLPCIRNKELSDEQKRAFVIADNRLSDMSYFDMSKVVEELQLLSEQNYDTMVTGFDLNELVGDNLDELNAFFADKVFVETVIRSVKSQSGKTVFRFTKCRQFLRRDRKFPITVRHSVCRK